MIGFMRVMRGLVAVAILSIALQPCLACAPDQAMLAEVRSAEPCHEPTHQLATACPELLGADIAVAPTVPVGILAALPASLEVVFHPLRSLGESTVAPVAPADGPPLWLRHASLLV